MEWNVNFIPGLLPGVQKKFKKKKSFIWWRTHAIFSLGDLHGTSSSNSSSLSSPSSAISCDMFNVELVNISGTGNMLGLLELRLWFIISGLSKFGFSPVLGISRWLPVTFTSNVTEPGDASFRHWRESLNPAFSTNVATMNRNREKKDHWY